MSQISALTLTLAAIRKSAHALPVTSIDAILNKNIADVPYGKHTACDGDALAATLLDMGLIAENANGFYVRKSKRLSVDKLIQKVKPSRLIVDVPEPSAVVTPFGQNKSAGLVILATIRKSTHAIHAEALRAMLLKKFNEATAQDIWYHITLLLKAGLIRATSANDQCFYVAPSKRDFVDSIINKVKLPTLDAAHIGEALLANALNGGDTRGYRHDYN